MLNFHFKFSVSWQYRAIHCSRTRQGLTSFTIASATESEINSDGTEIKHVHKINTHIALSKLISITKYTREVSRWLICGYWSFG